MPKTSLYHLSPVTLSNNIQTMPSSTCTPQPNHLQTLLNSAQPFLRGQLETVDPNLPSLITVLKSVGAGECWHKHGTFLDHLIDIYRILKLWDAPDPLCLCGLFHSAYSNSYVNLAIFDPSTGRDVVRRHVGVTAERLIHLFCIVPRQQLIHDNLLFRYSDESELVQHVKESEISLVNARKSVFQDVTENSLVNERESVFQDVTENSLTNARKSVFQDVMEDEGWRRKLQSILPADGVVMKHIKTGEDVHLSRRVVAMFLLMTIADFSDQLFSFQDVLFENSDGMLKFAGNEWATALWPGDGKPGLWMNSISRMGAIYTLIVREEELYAIAQSRLSNSNSNSNSGNSGNRDEEIELVIPPILENCTKVLSAKDQIEARDLYWEGVCEASKRGLDGCEEVLRRSVVKNPFVGEPHVVLSQICLSKGRFDEAEKEAEEGLRLLLEWGSPWDKRMTWEGWIAWCRVLLMKAKEKSWPQTSWGILNLGLVR